MLLSVVQAGAQMPQLQPPMLDLHALFEIVGQMFGLDPSLLEAVALTESAEQPGAVSPKGAVGLMQLMPSTAERFGVVDPMDPVESVLGAARFIDYLRRWQLARTGSDANIPMLLAAYNAGEGAVAKYNGVPPYAETREYVRRVIIAYLLDGLMGRPQLSRQQPVNNPRPPVVLRHALRPIGSRMEQPSRLHYPDVFAQLAEIRRQRAQHLHSQATSTSIVDAARAN
jgi:hypothetical protein